MAVVTAWPRTRLVAVLAGLALLAGCGERTDSAEPQGPVSSPTAVPAAEGEVTGRATVLDDGEGPELCLGSIALSLPPQCDGPKVIGWDWADHPEAESASGVRWGGFVVTGHWDGSSFAATEARVATEADNSSTLGEPPPPTPCEEPAGGWKVLDPATTTMSTRDALSRAAEAREDYGLIWVDQSINPAAARIHAGEQSLELSQAMNDPKLMIMNVGVTGDVAEAEADLRPLWGGPLCVYRVANTQARLRAAAEELMDLPGSLDGGYGSISNTVELSVIYDDGSIQQWADQTYGEGVVEITSALTPGVG